MQDAVRVLAGDCTVTYEDDAETTTRRGVVVALVKPDNTVLVHDADGYQPAAWLTRADTVRVARDDGFAVRAGKGEQSLAVDCETLLGHATYPVSPAGPHVGTCPDCEGALVRANGAVVCTDCRARYPIPTDATVGDDTCPDCGLPEATVDRGATVRVCVDYSCRSLADAVADRFDGEWPCPDCGTGMEIEWARGVRAVCPDCDRRLAVPRGLATGTCRCGLPRFDTPTGERCLDPECPTAT